MFTNKYIKRTGDFSFEPFKSQVEYGDSGPLLIATPYDKQESKYIIKHSHADCAANEFVYTQIGHAMNLRMPEVVLFQVPDHQIPCPFQSKYVMGSAFVSAEIENPTYEQIRDKAENWKDYYRFRAMYALLDEVDSFEILLSTDGYIYRIDTSASFGLDTHFMLAASYPQFQNIICEYIKGLNYDKPWRERHFLYYLQQCIESYGQESKKIFLEPFARIIELRPDYIDRFLNTLCVIYPDIIGDYYKNYIAGLQKQTELFLKYIN